MRESSSHPITVAGAPAERHAEFLLRCRRAADQGQTIVWVTPSPAASAANRVLLGRPVLGISVTTLRRLADQLIHADSHRLPLAPAARRALISELASKAQHSSALGPLEELAASPGLIDFLSSRFRSLRRDGIGADKALPTLRRLDGPRAGGVLARLYGDYLAALNSHDLLDEEGVLLAATEQVAAGSWRVDLLILDLPVAVSPIERRLAEALIDAAEESLVSCSGLLGAEWAESRQADEVIQAAPLTDLRPAIKRVREGLFDDDAQPVETTEGVAVLPGDNAQDTARRVARRVKRLLARGEATAGQIVIAAPRLESSAPRYAEALAEHGVPFAVDLAASLGSTALVGAIIDLLHVAESDWAFEPLLDLLSRGDLPALRQGKADGFASPVAATEWFVRELQVPSGRRYLQRQAETIASIQEPNDSLRRLVAAAREAAGVFEQLAGALDNLPADEGTPLAWLDRIDDALRSLGHPGMSGSPDPDDRAAGDALEEAAASIENLARWRGREPRRLRLGAVKDLISGWATRLRLPARQASEGRVRVVGAVTAIGLPCVHLFVVDADESSFAAGDAGSPVEAMRSFWELVATPVRSLTLAYAAFDASAQPTPPSPFVTEVERLFTPGALRADAEPLLAPITTPTLPASRREERVAATLAAVEGKGDALARYGELAMVDTLTAIHARATGDAFGPWEGLLDNAAAKRFLAERYDSEKIWSVSQLELMATCPYKFFARRLLRMEPIGELTVGVDYRRRGSLMHDALAECLGEIAAELPPGRTLRDLPEENLSQQLAARIDTLVEARSLPAYEGALLAIEARQAKDWASRYADQQRKFEGDRRWGGLDRPLSPSLLEVRFGPAVGGEDSAEDFRSVDEPFGLTLPTGEVLKLAGRIDRIDTAPVGDQTVFAVIDYKTSSSYTSRREQIESGKQLQPVLYALATQSLFLGESAVPVGAGYWAVRKRGYVAPSEKELPIAHIDEGHVSSSDDWLAIVEAVRDKCGELVAEVRDGVFPMNNEDEHCGSSCEFRTVCRVGQARSVGKAPTSRGGAA